MHCSTSFVFKILVFVTSDDPNTAIYVPGHLKWQTGLFQCRQQMLINMNDNWGRNKSSYASNAEYWSNTSTEILLLTYIIFILHSKWMGKYTFLKSSMVTIKWTKKPSHIRDYSRVSEWHHKKAFMRCELKNCVLPSIQNMTD